MDCLNNDTRGLSPVKRFFLLLLLVSDALFISLLFVKGARQNEIFVYDELCDYRMFIQPCMTSERPYSASTVHRRDACYPPIAYCMVKALSTDKGQCWLFSRGEFRLLLSLFLAQGLGAILLARKIAQRNGRLFAVIAILMSPACICTLLRGNTSGWAFALVCLFLFWYKSNSLTKRIVAATALGVATSLKLTPCLFGVLYLSDTLFTPSRIPWWEIGVGALTAILLIFLPFLFFGGVEAIPQWISNAGANAAFYSSDNPLWGLAALANHLIDSTEMTLPYIGRFALATRILAVALVLLVFFVRSEYGKLLGIGAAMAFLTHHDYGGAYLIPAFMVWMCDGLAAKRGVKWLLQAIAWFIILTPLQIPNPFFSGTLNAMLQNEFLFVLLVLSIFSPRLRELSHDKAI